MNAAPVDVRIEAMISRFAPDVADPLRRARCHLRDVFTQGHELVFDNYNALVFAFSPSLRATDAMLSVAGYPRWVTLFFSHGVDLRDPGGLLQGTGSRVRSVRMQGHDRWLDPAVQSLIAQALQPHRDALRAAPPLQTVIKSVSARQRPRRVAPSTK